MANDHALYATYCAGFAGRARPDAGAEEGSPLARWAELLGRSDASLHVPLRPREGISTWALCCEAYLSACAGAIPSVPDDGGAAPTVQLATYLALRDTEHGRRRTPLELARMLRGLGA